MMTIKDHLIPRVNVFIDIWDVSGSEPRLIARRAEGNLAVLNGRNLIRDFLAGDNVSGLQRFALGTEARPSQASDTRLGAEVFRDQFTQIVKADGELIIKYYLGSLAANGYNIAEAGLFGNGASDAKDSGVLYARVTLAPIAKTSALAATFVWELTWEVS